MDSAARDAIAAAIAEAVGEDGSKVNGFITKGFGGPVLIAGADLEPLVQDAIESAGKLIAATR